VEYDQQLTAITRPGRGKYLVASSATRSQETRAWLIVAYLEAWPIVADLAGVADPAETSGVADRTRSGRWPIRGTSRQRPSDPGRQRAADPGDTNTQAIRPGPGSRGRDRGGRALA
jgi:hypothetical protein